jgi:hypothetical protein
MFRLMIYLSILTFVLIGGCTSNFMSDLDLEQAIKEDILQKMSPSEANFTKSILFPSEPNPKGSIKWLDQNIFGDFMPSKYTRIISTVVLVTFYYPATCLPCNGEQGVIFANAGYVQDVNSTNEYVEWVSVARLASERHEYIQASCKFIFWFTNMMEENRPEKYLEVLEEFELKDKQWQLSEVKTHSITF